MPNLSLVASFLYITFSYSVPRFRHRLGDAKLDIQPMFSVCFILKIRFGHLLGDAKYDTEPMESYTISSSWLVIIGAYLLKRVFPGAGHLRAWVGHNNDTGRSERAGALHPHAVFASTDVKK